MVYLALSSNLHYLRASAITRNVIIALTIALYLSIGMQLACQEAYRLAALKEIGGSDPKLEETSFFLLGLMKLMLNYVHRGEVRYDSFASGEVLPTLSMPDCVQCLTKYRHLSCGFVVIFFCALVLFGEYMDIRRIHKFPRHILS